LKRGLAVVIEAFVIGLIVGFLFYELTGISPGGVVPPAYFALFIAQPGKILVTLLLAIAVWGTLITAAKYLVVYGRRRMLLAILLGCALKIILEFWIRPDIPVGLNLESIGYVIPGLIANEMARQRPLPTLAGLGIVTVVVALILLLIHGRPF